MADEAVRSRGAESWTQNTYDPRFRFAQYRSVRSSRGYEDAGRTPADSSTDTSRTRMRVARTLLVGAILTLVTVVAGEIVFQYVIAPNLAITTIRMDGDAVLTREELLEATGLSSRVLYLHVDVARIEERLATVPLVRSASVRKEFPDTLVVDIQARTPLFVVDVVTDGATIPVAGDQDGVLFREALAGDLTLPVISGVQFRNFSFGDALPDELEVLFQDLRVLRRDHMELFDLISEIRVVPVGQRYETILYPIATTIPVRLDARARAQTYEQALRVASFVRAEHGEDNVAEIDLRGRDVVYTLRGEG